MFTSSARSQHVEEGESVIMESGQRRAVEVATVVFFDLEATELPSVGVKPRITELCLTAVQREELKTARISPRVLNQLQLCFNPVKPIPPNVSCITGLYNDILESQSTFSKNTCQLIQNFLDHLKPPVCLLAHNGDRFDFPLLLAEFSRCQVSLPAGILCGDSLKAFTALDLSRDPLERGSGGFSHGVAGERGRGGEERSVDRRAEGPGLIAAHVVEGEGSDTAMQARNEVTPEKKPRTASSGPPPVKRSRSASESSCTYEPQRRKLDFDLNRDVAKSAGSGTTEEEVSKGKNVPSAKMGCRQSSRCANLTREDEVELQGRAAIDSACGESAKRDGPLSPSGSDAERFSLTSEKTIIYTSTDRSEGDEKSGSCAGGKPEQGREPSSETVPLNSKESLSDQDLLLAVAAMEREARYGACGDGAPSKRQCAEDQQSGQGEGGRGRGTAAGAGGGTPGAPDQRRPRVSYSLVEVFRRLFGALPWDSHSAAGDNTALLRCARRYCPNFLHWLDENAVALTSHQPMY